VSYQVACFASINRLCAYHSVLRLILIIIISSRHKRVPVTTAWRVLRLRTEERSPIGRVAANILNKQSWSADKGVLQLDGWARC